MPTTADMPLDELPEMSEQEYAAFMRRIGAEDETTVSAFNSSI